MEFSSKNAITAENIKHMMLRRNMSTTDLAAKLNMSRQNLNKKFRLNRFYEHDLRDISTALAYEVIISFVEKGE